MGCYRHIDLLFITLIQWALVACAIVASDCTRTDAAFATMTEELTATGTWTQVPTITDAITANQNGLALAADQGVFLGVVGTSKWVPPVDITFSIQINNPRLVDGGGGLAWTPGFFKWVDATSEVNEKIGCSEYLFQMRGRNEITTIVHCCRKDCKTPLAIMIEGTGGGVHQPTPPSNNMTWQTAPGSTGKNEWTIHLDANSATMSYKKSAHGLKHDSGDWPGSDVPQGLRPAFYMNLDEGNAGGVGTAPATMVVSGLSIVGCSVGVFQPGTIAITHTL